MGTTKCKDKIPRLISYFQDAQNLKTNLQENSAVVTHESQSDFKILQFLQQFITSFFLMFFYKKYAKI